MAADNLAELRSYMVTADDLLRAIPTGTIMKYRELSSVPDLAEALARGPIILLYPIQSENVGHWTLLWRTRQNMRPRVNFFCPYSSRVDQIIYEGHTPGRQHPHLSELLVRLPEEYDIAYSEFRLQADRPDVTTCGRWVMYRWQHRDKDEYGFRDHVVSGAQRQGISPDDFVVLETRHVGR